MCFRKKLGLNKYLVVTRNGAMKWLDPKNQETPVSGQCVHIVLGTCHSESSQIALRYNLGLAISAHTLK